MVDLIDLTSLGVVFQPYMVSTLESANVGKVIREISKKIGDVDVRGVSRLFCFTGFAEGEGLKEFEDLMRDFPTSVFLCGNYCGYYYGFHRYYSPELRDLRKKHEWLGDYDKPLDKSTITGFFSVIEEWKEKYSTYVPLYFERFFHGKLYYIASSSLYPYDYVITGSANVSGSGFSLNEFGNKEFNLLLQVPKQNRIKLWMYDLLQKCYIPYQVKNSNEIVLFHTDLEKFERDFTVAHTVERQDEGLW